jgi:hypothetical protein
MAGLLCVLMLLGTASRANAWFEWLDYLSGPGRFWGGRVDVRMWCSGQPTPTRGLQEELDRAFETARRVVNTADWVNVARHIEQANVQSHALMSGQIRTLELYTSRLTGDDFEQFQRRVNFDGGRKLPSNTNPSDVNAVDAAYSVLQDAVNVQRQPDIAVGAGAIFISLCPKEIDRRWAFELGASLMGAAGDPKYAAGDAIGLTTYTAAVTYRLPTDRDHDYVDLGFEGGQYTFFSGGFETFHGPIVEPFVDLHFPSNWAARRGHRGALSHFSARVGLVYFPQGFETSQFGAIGPSRHLSGGDAIRNIVIYYRLQ